MNHDDHPEHDDHGGLVRDLRTLSRRRMFALLARGAAGAALLPILGCATDPATSGPDAGGDSCAPIPSETGGPYPGDGTNGPDALTLSGIERADIRTSVGSASGTADGVAFTVTMTIVSATTCAPLANHRVYIWHCTRDGDYSMYTGAAQAENYLRGVQTTDAQGRVSFTTIFPGCYAGRWPHIHFEVFDAGGAKVATSQLALPKATCDAVYATTGYEASATNLARVTLASDNVFADGATLQLPAISGSAGSDLVATLVVAVRA